MDGTACLLTASTYTRASDTSMGPLTDCPQNVFPLRIWERETPEQVGAKSDLVVRRGISVLSFACVYVYMCTCMCVCVGGGVCVCATHSMKHQLLQLYHARGELLAIAGRWQHIQALPTEEQECRSGWKEQERVRETERASRTSKGMQAGRAFATGCVPLRYLQLIFVNNRSYEGCALSLPEEHRQS